MRLPGGARPIVIAHRGGAAEAPENTLEAFERAIRLGYPGVEFDVRCSSDGVPVVVHDAKVPASPGGPRRAVAGTPAAELALPRLDFVLDLPWGRMALMVEVKPTDRDAELGALVARALAARGRAGQAIVASFSASVLWAAEIAAPGLPLMGLLDSKSDEGDFRGLPLSAWGVDVALVCRDRVLRWKDAVSEVWTWTIEDLGQARRALEAGVDGLITDIPGAVIDHLARPPRAV